MKRLITILSVAFVAISSAFSAGAQDSAGEVTLLTVNLKNGTREQYNLPDKPQVSFADGKMFIECPEMSGEYALKEVSNINFEKGREIVGISEIPDAGNTFTFSYVDNASVLMSGTGLKSVAVYNLNGMLVTTVEAVDGAVAIDVSAFAPGVYIVAPSCHAAVKIVKK